MKLLPPPDLTAFFYCTYTLYRKDGRPHLCERRAVAVYDGPLGRLPRCYLHQRVFTEHPEYRQVAP